MIAWAGAERLALRLTDSLDVAPRARWPLDQVSKPEPLPVAREEDRPIVRTAQ
jgi:N6-L-threonylcarbamoyladenine synthase